MICSSCGVTNDVGRKFCADCGARLAVSCPSCDSPNAPTARFCGECGTPLPDAAAPVAASTPATATQAAASLGGPAPTAERRIVSVMFADLVGFTSFAEQRDSEDVRETLTRYFELAREIVDRYGGTVEKFIGDAVMAVWGAPTAHEDDAERSVRAAMELIAGVRVLGEGISARAGVLTGEAAVTIGATNQGMVAGDLVNTAARLQSVADPGSVLVGESTMHAARGAIAFEAVGDQSLKGKSIPVAAWRASRVVAERGGRNRTETLEAPFVGRDDELRLLKDWFHATGRDRRLRTVSITGQGGIGKSRLAWEFEKYLDGLVEDVYWHHGRSPSLGDGLSFWALGEMVRGRFGLAETDDDATTRERVVADLPRWVPDEADRRWIEPALLTLLGVDGGGSRLGHEQLFGAWRTFLERIADQGTVVLVFEDLHWADDGLLAFIDHLSEWSRSSPIYLVTLARPELLDRRPDWGAGLRHFANMALEPLSPGAMRELLSGLVPGLPEAAASAVVARADGVPLYAVETVRMLVAEGRLVAREDGTYEPIGDLSTLAVPPTLQSLIAARLDALDAADRSLLQAASVLGQSFIADALRALIAEPTGLESRLASLVRRDVLVHDVDPRSTERGQYSFVQALVREVAYGTLARADRRRLHLAAARYLEAQADEVVVGALAAQYLAAWLASAGGAEADALAMQARIALRSAAERAATLGSMDQAVHLYRQALEVTTDDLDRAAILERAGHLATEGGRLDAAGVLLTEAESLYRDVGDRSAEARVVARQAHVLSGSNHREAGLGMIEAAAERFADLGDDPGLVAVMAQLSRFLFLAHHMDRAIEVADRTLPIAERLDLLPVVADLLVTRGTALASIGREYEGIAVLEGGLKLAVAHGLTMTEMRARINLSGPMNLYDVRAAEEIAAIGFDLAMRLGMKSYLPNLAGNAAVDSVETGDWDLAMARLESTMDSGLGEEARVQLQFFWLFFRLHRGDDVASVVASVDRSLVDWIEAGEPSLIPARHYLAATVDDSAGRFADAWEHMLAAAQIDTFNAASSYGLAISMGAMSRDQRRIRVAMDGLEGTGSHAPMSKLWLRIGAAAIAALEGRPRESLGAFRECLAAAGPLGIVYTRASLGLMMGTLLDPTLPEVRTALEEARDTYARLRARPRLEHVEAILEASAGPAPARVARATTTSPSAAAPQP